MNLFQKIAVFIFRLYGCWLVLSSLLGVGYMLIGLMFGGQFATYVDRFPADLLYLAAAWLIFRFSARVGKWVGRDLTLEVSNERTVM